MTSLYSPVCDRQWARAPPAGRVAAAAAGRAHTHTPSYPHTDWHSELEARPQPRNAPDTQLGAYLGCYNITKLAGIAWVRDE